MSQKVGYNDAFRRQQEQAEREAEAERRERAAANANAREEYLAGLQAKRGAAEHERAAGIDAEITPRMLKAERTWRIEHPGGDFEKVRDLVRQQILDEGRQAALAEARQQLRATGKY